MHHAPITAAPTRSREWLAAEVKAEPTRLRLEAQRANLVQAIGSSRSPDTVAIARRYLTKVECALRFPPTAMHERRAEFGENGWAPAIQAICALSATRAPSASLDGCDVSEAERDGHRAAFERNAA